MPTIPVPRVIVCFLSFIFLCVFVSAYDYVVPGMGKVIAKTDIQVELPEGCYGRVAPRSGLAAKHHIDIGGKRACRVRVGDYLPSFYFQLGSLTVTTGGMSALSCSITAVKSSRSTRETVLLN